MVNPVAGTPLAGFASLILVMRYHRHSKEEHHQ